MYMRVSHFLIILSSCIPLTLASQSGTSAPYQISGGFNYFSNSFNGVPGYRHALSGWDAAVAFPAWRSLRFKIDVSGLNGTNNGAPQHVIFILAGGQYERFVHREGFYVQALLGDGRLNQNWGPGGSPGMTASFSTVIGGGLDTRLTRHFALRVEGDFQYANFALIQSTSYQAPYEIPGLPNYYGRFSSGIVWTPRVNGIGADPVRSYGSFDQSPESELTFEDLNSVGHYHVFATGRWSYLHVAGIEYDRHSWGKFIGAQMDYVAEILPVVILRDPADADVWGSPQATAHKTVPGLGISPVGLRMLWRDGKEWEPYFTVKGGLIGFTQKVLSPFASYQDFTLQENIGLQFRLTRQWDLRAGVGDFHFSNAFAEPSNPGIDEMTYGAALSYRLSKRGK
jgi:Lipid A 3-O-deacylase (PagL)